MSQAFTDLSLPAATIENLNQLGYTEMTPIQMQAIPLGLQNSDVIAQAKTGSGKTAAFGIPLLEKLDLQNQSTQALILCPTRELADQVATELRRLARAKGNVKILTLGGGVAMHPQTESLAYGAQVVVGTAGRIQKHLDAGSLKLDNLKTLVLDEADRMLDMGFYDSIRAIINLTPKKRQTLLFSATYPDNIRKLAEDFMQSPAHVTVESEHSAQQIEQRFYEIDAGRRFEMVEKALYALQPKSCVAFCFTKQQCDELAQHLNSKGFNAGTLHGDLDQRERDLVLLQFANGSIPVLIATDVAARGLDIAGLDLVLNVELSAEPETHIHRIGRTGRAGESGLAVSLVAPRESRRASAIEALQSEPFVWHDIKELDSAQPKPVQANMRTIGLLAGKKDKLRPADIVGALTTSVGIPFNKIGKINIFDHYSYVAVDQGVAKQVVKKLGETPIKGRNIKARLV